MGHIIMMQKIISRPAVDVSRPPQGSQPPLWEPLVKRLIMKLSHQIRFIKTKFCGINLIYINASNMVVLTSNSKSENVLTGAET